MSGILNDIQTTCQPIPATQQLFSLVKEGLRKVNEEGRMFVYLMCTVYSVLRKHWGWSGQVQYVHSIFMSVSGTSNQTKTLGVCKRSSEWGLREAGGDVWTVTQQITAGELVLLNRPGSPAFGKRMSLRVQRVCSGKLSIIQTHLAFTRSRSLPCFFCLDFQM